MQVRTHAIAAAAVFAIALATRPAAGEDLTIVSKTTRDGGPASMATSYLSSDHARMVQPDGQEAILDLKTGQMTIVDGRKKEYFVVTRQDMDQLKARLQQQMNSPEMQRAQEQMKNLPPDLQKRMQAAMGAVGASLEVKKTGTTRKVAGYTCENWVVTIGALSKTEQCLTSDLPIPVQAWDAYREFAESMKSMTAGMGAMGKGIADMQAKMKEMRGYPMAVTTSTNMMGRTMNLSTEVVEVKKGPIPASAWDVPAGYRKVDNPMSKALPPR
jgi:hypothetical protein